MSKCKVTMKTGTEVIFTLEVPIEKARDLANSGKQFILDNEIYIDSSKIDKIEGIND